MNSEKCRKEKNLRTAILTFLGWINALFHNVFNENLFDSEITWQFIPIGKVNLSRQ